MRITFREIKLTGHKTGICTTCGKKHKRQKTFSQTLNPFNKIDGLPKTTSEIYSELGLEIKEWEQKSITCNKEINDD